MSDPFPTLFEHQAFCSLKNLNQFLAQTTLNLSQRRVFACSLVAFNFSIPSGILSLSNRATDRVFQRDPMKAHSLGSKILSPAVDEFGLTGTSPHYPLMIFFGEALGVSREDLVSHKYAVRSAKIMGSKMHDWYRSTPEAFSLGVHLASELTSQEEYVHWAKTFTSDRYHEIKPGTPAHTYLLIHSQLEPEHTENSLSAVKEFLRLFDEQDEVMRGANEYLEFYGEMMEEILETLDIPAKPLVRAQMQKTSPQPNKNL